MLTPVWLHVTLVVQREKVRMKPVLFNTFKARVESAGAGCRPQNPALTPELPGVHGNTASYTDGPFEMLYNPPSFSHLSLITV